MLQLEGRLIRFPEKVKSSISTYFYKELFPKGSHPGVIYGLAKIHKPK